MNIVDPDQDRHSVGSLLWVLTVCKGFQQMTKMAASRERVFFKDYLPCIQQHMKKKKKNMQLLHITCMNNKSVLGTRTISVK